MRRRSTFGVDPDSGAGHRGFGVSPARSKAFKSFNGPARRVAEADARGKPGRYAESTNRVGAPAPELDTIVDSKPAPHRMHRFENLPTGTGPRGCPDGSRKPSLNKLTADASDLRGGPKPWTTVSNVFRQEIEE